MKTYFIDNPHDWLDELIPDIIDEINRPNPLDAGYIYAPYIPLYKTPPIFNPDDFLLRKAIGSRPKIANRRFFKTVTIDDKIYDLGGDEELDNGPTKMPEPKRPVATRKRILENLAAFIKRRPDEVPSSFTSVPESLQKIMVDRCLKSYTNDGVLNYDKEQKGWWRPEVLDAMAALSDGSTAEDDTPVLGPSESETPSL